MNCPESRCRCGYAVVAVAFFASALASAVGSAAYRGLADRLASVEHAVATPVSVDLSAVMARLDSADRHIAELARVSHDRRSALAAESVARGQQITAERRERRADVDRLSGETVAAVALVLREQDARLGADEQLSAIIGGIGKRLATVEDRPTPERVIERVEVQVPVYLYPIVPQRCR